MQTRYRLFLFSLWLAAGLQTQATQFVPLTVEQLAEKSTLVLHGRVKSKSCQRDAEGRIYTKVELQVAEIWKGAVPGDQFTIVHGGGVLGEEVTVASGQVCYEVGEEVVAFLVLNQRGEGVTLGLAQGKFRVKPHQASGEKRASNAFHGDLPETPNEATVNRPTTKPLSLSELKRRVMGGRP